MFLAEQTRGLLEAYYATFGALLAAEGPLTRKQLEPLAAEQFERAELLGEVRRREGVNPVTFGNALDLLTRRGVLGGAAGQGRHAASCAGPRYEELAALRERLAAALLPGSVARPRSGPRPEERDVERASGSASGCPRERSRTRPASCSRWPATTCSFPGRTYYPPIDDPEIECVLIRAQEMARYVEQGVIDCGITGLDWVLENKAKVKELADLVAPWPNYRPVRWVLAVKDDSRFKSVKDLAGKRIATEVVGLTKALPEQHGVQAEVEFSWGATEVKPPILADAIVDVTETGLGPARERPPRDRRGAGTTPRFIANRERTPTRGSARRWSTSCMLLRGAIAAAARVGLMMNVPRENLDAIVEVLPALGDAHDLRARRRALGRGQHRRRREARARAASRGSAEAGAHGHRRVPAQQDRRVSGAAAARRRGLVLLLLTVPYGSAPPGGGSSSAQVGRRVEIVAGGRDRAARARPALACAATCAAGSCRAGTSSSARRGEDALRREVREETGLEVAIERVVGDYRRTGFRPHRARVYRCRAIGGALRRAPRRPRRVLRPRPRCRERSLLRGAAGPSPTRSLAPGRDARSSATSARAARDARVRAIDLTARLAALTERKPPPGTPTGRGPLHTRRTSTRKSWGASAGPRAGRSLHSLPSCCELARELFELSSNDRMISVVRGMSSPLSRPR